MKKQKRQGEPLEEGMQASGQEMAVEIVEEKADQKTKKAGKKEKQKKENL